MDPSRRRIGSLVEWAVAGACTAAAVLLLSTAAEELRGVRPFLPVRAEEPAVAAPVVDLPSGVASIPLLLLGDAREVRLGERLADVAGRLGSLSQLVSETVEEKAGGRRITRVYNDVGVQFILVFEAVRDAEPRLSAIFLN